MSRTNLSSLVLLFALFVSTAVFAGAGQKYQANLIKKFYSMGTASISGTYYPVGTSISRLFSNKIKQIVTIAEPTAGSVANVSYLMDGQIDLALLQGDVAWMAYHGSSNYSGNSFKNLRILASLYSEKVQIVVKADSDIKTISDLKGKRISVGEKDSGSAASAVQIFEMSGLKAGEDYNLIYERFTKSTESLLDGYIDAIYYVGAVPANGITRLANRVKVRLIEVPSDLIVRLTKEFPCYFSESINEESYNGQKERINTLGFRALLACTDSLPVSEAKLFLSTIYEHPRIFSDQNELLVELNIEEALRGVDNSMLHEGALAFFNEAKKNKPR